ncbi:hypothetical protein LUZ61_008116 [Rhynchospora tenuis]|uniref:Pectinesterase inhibitor domain-containing protein n=1 Tax=Rhynchospora tenuis TaxID=198213 RepID=A0AAD6EX58_9POAL|nr:hypothetical protein LUZ61_008116 [Rhynchospora tenuis]
MEASLVSFIAVLFLLSSHPLSVAADIAKVDEVCNNVGGWYVTPAMCHSVLDTDPQSSTADLNGVGVIGANIVAKNATLTLGSIKKILDASSDPNQKKGLETCVLVYTNIIPKLNGAVASMKSKKYSEALEVMSEALAVPAKCDTATMNYPNLKMVLDRVGIPFSTVASVGQAVAGYLSSNYSA